MDNIDWSRESRSRSWNTLPLRVFYSSNTLSRWQVCSRGKQRTGEKMNERKSEWEAGERRWGDGLCWAFQDRPRCVSSSPVSSPALIILYSNKAQRDRASSSGGIMQLHRPRYSAYVYGLLQWLQIAIDYWWREKKCNQNSQRELDWVHESAWQFPFWSCLVTTVKTRVLIRPGIMAQTQTQPEKTLRELKPAHSYNFSLIAAGQLAVTWFHKNNGITRVL